MPQRRRRPYRLLGRACRARNLWLALSTACLLVWALPTNADPLDDQAAALSQALGDDPYCLFIPPKPIDGIFEPDADHASALLGDHDLALAIERPLRDAGPGNVITLAPSEGLTDADLELGGPLLARILHRLLWLYADYWAAARTVIVERSEPALPKAGLEPLRAACDPAVALFIFKQHEDEIEAAFVSLLTGQVLARY